MTSSDFSKPQSSDLYTSIPSEINAINADLSKGLDPATSSPINVPTNALRWNSANGYWEKFSGTVWSAMAAIYNICAATAVKLAIARAIAFSGDVAGTGNFDGSQNISIALTLPNVNANPGTAGSSTQVPVVTSNSKGQITGISLAAIAFPAAPVSSVFGRTGAVALALSDVVGALGYTPPTPIGGGASGTWGINVSGTAYNITAYTINQSLGTGNTPTFAGLAINGQMTATGNITAYYSDDRLKTRLGYIEDALGKVKQLSGFYYEANKAAQSLGYKKVREVGVSAQQVQSVLPEAVAPAPIDAKYLTVRYERLTALLIEAIKELDARVDSLSKEVMAA